MHRHLHGGGCLAIKNAWFTLAVAFIILFFSSGLRFSFGIVLKPISEDLGWTKAETTMAATAFFVVSALVMPIYGRLIDRYSLVRIMIISICGNLAWIRLSCDCPDPMAVHFFTESFLH